VITPCRNEAEYLQQTIDTMAVQSVLPTVWIIVDDGSTDETPAILERATKSYPFIRVVHRTDRGKRAVGPGVIEAFYDGLATINLDDYDYICKLDGDLLLPSRYFEILMERMESDSRLGTCSGKPYYLDPKTNRLVSEKCGDEMSVGMTKFYRVDCFRDIGGFVRQVMWDAIDCHTCRMKGWVACSWDESDIRFTHLRPMGSSHKGIFTGRMRHGFGQYFMGTGILYMSASAIYRMSRPPLIMGGLSMWLGYVSAMLKRSPRYEDLEFRRFLHRFQWQMLLHGKGKATDAIHQQIETRVQPDKNSPSGKNHEISGEGMTEEEVLCQ